MKTLISFFVTLSCASIPPADKFDDYKSLVDYLKRGYQEAEIERYQFFSHPTEPVSVTIENHYLLTFVGDRNGPGYCLRQSYPRPDKKANEEKVYCSLDGSGRLDSIAWGTAALNGKFTSYEMGERRFNPSSLNGQSWEQLQWWFDDFKQEFMTAAGNDRLYQGAVRKMRR